MKTIKGLTEFGKVCRTIRIKCEETTSDMSEKLEVSVSYLSLMERGKRPVPTKVVKKLMKNYKLDKEQKEQLQQYLDEK